MQKDRSELTPCIYIFYMVQGVNSLHSLTPLHMHDNRIVIDQLVVILLIKEGCTMYVLINTAIPTSHFNYIVISSH